MLSRFSSTALVGAAMFALGALLSPGLGAVAAQPLAQPDCVAAQPVTVPPGTLAHVGDRVESAGTALTVNGVRTTDALNQYQKAKPGRTFLVTDATIENTGPGSLAYNPYFFRAKDADGYEYGPTLAGGDQSLKSGDLLPGDKVRGSVTFDVPSSARGLVVRYQPPSLGADQPFRVAVD